MFNSKRINALEARVKTLEFSVLTLLRAEVSRDAEAVKKLGRPAGKKDSKPRKMHNKPHCVLCGRKCKDTRGLGIHQARAHKDIRI